MKNIAVILARSGSKGLPNKNIKPLAGKPLLVWSIEAAQSAGVFDTIHVSTDSEYYREIALQHGADVPFLRSKETSSDTASSNAAIVEVLKNYADLGKTFDTAMLLQPTSPLRTPEDICSAFRIMDEKQAAAVVSVCEMEHPPQWCNTLPADGNMNGFIQTGDLPRQALETFYRINGAIYLFRTDDFLKKGTLVYDAGCYAYVMPQERSVDIDGPLDIVIVETILRTKTF